MLKITLDFFFYFMINLAHIQCKLRTILNDEPKKRLPFNPLPKVTHELGGFLRIVGMKKHPRLLLAVTVGNSYKRHFDGAPIGGIIQINLAR